jgi:hypothetical protein
MSPDLHTFELVRWFTDSNTHAGGVAAVLWRTPNFEIIGCPFTGSAPECDVENLRCINQELLSLCELLEGKP